MAAEILLVSMGKKIKINLDIIGGRVENYVAGFVQ